MRAFSKDVFGVKKQSVQKAIIYQYIYSMEHNYIQLLKSSCADNSALLADSLGSVCECDDVVPADRV